MTIIVNAMQTLWSKSKDRLDRDDLQKLANLSDMAELHATTLSDVLMGIGCTIAQGDESESFHDHARVSELIFNVSHQVESIAGLLTIGLRADEYLKETA